MAQESLPKSLSPAKVHYLLISHTLNFDRIILLFDAKLVRRFTLTAPNDDNVEVTFSIYFQNSS